MCAVGYYADFFSSEELNNGTHTWTERTDHGQYRNIRALAYAGPIFMGCGCFIMVVACVVICETRDKMIKIMEDQEKERKAKEARVVKPNFYDLIIGQVRRERVVSTSDDKEKKRQKLKEYLMRPGSAKSVKSEYACVGSALKRIPADIFTIDVDGKEDTSMAPIHMAKPHTLHVGNDQVTTKYPSASCLHDLLVMEDEQLNKLFTTTPAQWLSSSDPTSPTKIEPQLVTSPEVSPSPTTEKRPKVYDDDTGSVYSLNAEEHTNELDTRLPVCTDGVLDRPRPKSSLSRPRTPGGVKARESPSPPRKSSRPASRADFSEDESDIDLDIGQSDSNDEEDTPRGDSGKPVKGNSPTGQAAGDGGEDKDGSPDMFGATCDTKDTYESLGQIGLHGTAVEEGVSRATTPGPAEKEAYNNANIIVHAAVHREPALTEDDVESVLSQSLVGEGERGHSPTREPRTRPVSRATAVISPIPSESEDGRSLDSISLPDSTDGFDKSSHTVTANRVFQQTKTGGGKQTTDSAGDNAQIRPKTGIPGSNRDQVKVPSLLRDPNPRPMTSFMRPSEPHPTFPTKRKPGQNFAYSRNMPKMQGVSLGNVGLRPIRTNIKVANQSNSMKGRPKTGSFKSKNSYHNSTDDKIIEPKRKL